MKRFSWDQPCYPFIINQVWGIENPIYQQFGFSRHNGIDITNGQKEFNLFTPFNGVLVDKKSQNGGGNYITLRSIDSFLFDDGKAGFVFLDLLHLKELPTMPIGTIVSQGNLLAIADNTGFSTGPHTHMQFRRSASTVLYPIDQNEANNSFDPMPYCSGNFANAPLITKITDAQKALISALTLLVAQLKAKIRG